MKMIAAFTLGMISSAAMSVAAPAFALSCIDAYYERSELTLVDITVDGAVDDALTADVDALDVTLVSTRTGFWLDIRDPSTDDWFEDDFGTDGGE